MTLKPWFAVATPHEDIRNMTAGLATMLSHVARALSGSDDAGDRIVSLQVLAKNSSGSR